MKVITEKMIYSEYRKLQRKAKSLVEEGKDSEAISVLKTMGKFMYQYNCIYADQKADELLLILGKKFPCNLKNTPNQRSIVFYDYFAKENRGLTSIYIKALVALGYDILYITYQERSVVHYQSILKILSTNPNNEVYKIHHNDTSKAIKEIQTVINKFAPATGFIHTVPDDMIGLITFSTYENYMQRFMINITDHAFWLGTKSVDMSIEFRSYGYTISRKYRKMNRKQLAILPYYPNVDLDVDFRGFPFSLENKKLVFSGGSLYKIQGSTKFYEMIDYLMGNYPEAVFLFAGQGDKEGFCSFIEKRKYQDRVFFIQERKDLSQVMRRCRFYLSTYPMAGGLMAQYAVSEGKFPLTLNDTAMETENVESLFQMPSDFKFTYSSEEEFYKMMDRLMCDDAYLEKLERKMQGILISREVFTSELQSLIQNKRTSFKPENIKIDRKENAKRYIKVATLERHRELFTELNISFLWKEFPFLMIISVIFQIFKNIKETLWRK